MSAEDSVQDGTIDAQLQQQLAGNPEQLQQHHQTTPSISESGSTRKRPCLYIVVFLVLNWLVCSQSPLCPSCLRSLSHRQNQVQRSSPLSGMSHLFIAYFYLKNPSRAASNVDWEIHVLILILMLRTTPTTVATPASNTNHLMLVSYSVITHRMYMH